MGAKCHTPIVGTLHDDFNFWLHGRAREHNYFTGRASPPHEVMYGIKHKEESCHCTDELQIDNTHDYKL